MKLKKIEIAPARGAQSVPTISFTNSGIISISKAAVEKIGLKHGDTIAIHEDEDRPKDWYLQKTNNPQDHEIRSQKTPGSGLIFSSTPLVKKISSVLGLNPSISIKLSTEPTKVDMGGGVEITLYAILTNSATSRSKS